MFLKNCINAMQDPSEPSKEELCSVESVSCILDDKERCCGSPHGCQTYDVMHYFLNARNMIIIIIFFSYEN